MEAPRGWLGSQRTDERVAGVAAKRSPQRMLLNLHIPKKLQPVCFEHPGNRPNRRPRMAQNQTCPNPQLFRELLDGLLSESDQTLLAAHLDTCEDCRLKLDELTGELPVPPGVAQHPDQDSEPTETALFEAIKCIEEERPLDDQTHLDHTDEKDLSINFLDPSKQPGSLGPV